MAASRDQPSRGLLDTSVFIAKESRRPLGELPDSAAISVITVAELHLGVLMARGSAIRARRLRTLTAVQEAFEALPIDSDVALAFAELVASARRLGRRPKIMDTWIAATAIGTICLCTARTRTSWQFPRFARSACNLSGRVRLAVWG